MKRVRYGSVCSGIEAATVAWHPLGWTPVFFAEIKKFPSRVLAARWPGVPNLGDFTKIGSEHAIDLLVGGTPCQSFSVAGLRGGLADARGNLALEFLRLADRTRPEWLVWENVPGVLSSGGGRDFGSILGGMAELGYGFAYRVLDAQYFGLAQRRKRVFVVARLGDWRGPAAVLLERASLRGDPPPSREAGQEVAPTLRAQSQSSHRADSEHFVPEVSYALNAGAQGRLDSESETFIAHSLRAEGFDASEDGTGRGTPLVPAIAFQLKASASSNSMNPGHIAPSLGRSNADGTATMTGAAVRRLTPRECERLQGFHDDYTAIPGAADGPRYRALGNSMAVPVMRWIGRRIQRAVNHVER